MSINNPNQGNPNQPYQNDNFGLPPMKQESWLKRNGLWFFPLIIAVIGVPVLCCGGSFWGVASLAGAVMKPRDVAIEYLQDDPRVTEQLGSPLEPGENFFPKQYSVENNTGNATIQFDVDGPDGSAKVDGRMILNSGTWTPEFLTVTFSDGSEIVVPEGAVKINSSNSNGSGGAIQFDFDSSDDGN